MTLFILSLMAFGLMVSNQTIKLPGNKGNPADLGSMIIITTAVFAVITAVEAKKGRSMEIFDLEENRAVTVVAKHIHTVTSPRSQLTGDLIKILYLTIEVAPSEYRLIHLVLVNQNADYYRTNWIYRRENDMLVSMRK